MRKGKIMAKILITKYKCDICGKEFDDPKEISATSIPCYGVGMTPNDATQVDLCEKCGRILREIIWDNFAEISDDYGLSIKKKYE